jgi:hypothetical protein
MKLIRISPFRFVSAVVVLLGARSVHGQTPEPVWPEAPQRPLVPFDLSANFAGPDPGKASAQRVRLFMMPTGGVNDLTARDFGTAAVEPGILPQGADPTADLGLDATFDADNPYFDFRLPGDPGGVGYQRFQTGWQVLDTSDTGLSLNCQAVTPAGLQADGLANGPTWLSPGVSCSQRLGEDAGLQAFVSKNLRPQLRGGDSLEGTMRYGFALHQACPLLDGWTPGRVFWFMEAVGNVRTDELASSYGNALPKLVVLPGLHFQTAPNCWLSGGVLVPVNSAGARTDQSLWQVTCSWRF